MSVVLAELGYGAIGASQLAHLDTEQLREALRQARTARRALTALDSVAGPAAGGAESAVTEAVREQYLTPRHLADAVEPVMDALVADAEWVHENGPVDAALGTGAFLMAAAALLDTPQVRQEVTARIAAQLRSAGE